MKMVPIVVLLREDVLDVLAQITDRAVADGQLDLWTVHKAKNGWGNEAIVAGSILSNALRITEDETV